MLSSGEKFLQAVKETICALDEHQCDGRDVNVEHIDECAATCFSFKCTRCDKYVTYAIKDEDLNYTYPIEMELKFDD